MDYNDEYYDNEPKAKTTKQQWQPTGKTGPVLPVKDLQKGGPIDQNSGEDKSVVAQPQSSEAQQPSSAERKSSSKSTNSKSSEERKFTGGAKSSRRSPKHGGEKNWKAKQDKNVSKSSEVDLVEEIRRATDEIRGDADAFKEVVKQNEQLYSEATEMQIKHDKTEEKLDYYESSTNADVLDLVSDIGFSWKTWNFLKISGLVSASAKVGIALGAGYVLGRAAFDVKRSFTAMDSANNVSEIVKVVVDFASKFDLLKLARRYIRTTICGTIAAAMSFLAKDVFTFKKYNTCKYLDVYRQESYFYGEDQSDVEDLTHADLRPDAASASVVKHKLPLYRWVDYTSDIYFMQFHRPLKISAEILSQITHFKNLNLTDNTDKFVLEKLTFSASNLQSVNYNRYDIIGGDAVIHETVAVAFGMYKSYQEDHQPLPLPRTLA